MAAVLRWCLRLFALLAMLLFAAMMVIFVIVTVDQFGQKQYVTDSVGGLPPVYVLTAILVPFCAAFVGGFWWLFLDTFRDGPEDANKSQIGHTLPVRDAWRLRLMRWGKTHRPAWTRRAANRF